MVTAAVTIKDSIVDIQDLEYIFYSQIEEGTTKLYFMLIDGGNNTILRHNSSDLASLLPVLDSFCYLGSEGGIPRFVK